MSATPAPAATGTTTNSRSTSPPRRLALSQADFARATELRETEGRETEPPYFGRLTTELPIYSPSTINLKTMAHTRPVGERHGRSQAPLPGDGRA
ncbi:DUF2199 domain-containing protein [Kitasatospora aureofaciens]|uniref:DUF2199 domain-containing protein n=1 Tax=Kitasatospora aureofaciens TaxID=1894 RepID=UPI003D322CBD